MLADQRAYGRERVVFSDKFNCVVITSGLDQCNVARDIDFRRALGNTWYGVSQVCYAV